jgi:hypothetical protein
MMIFLDEINVSGEVIKFWKGFDLETILNHPKDGKMGLMIVLIDSVEVIRKESLAKQKKILSEWVAEIENFVEYVNGVNQTSVQAQLHNAGCDTLFEKIASSEHRRISRIAVELSGLAEALKGYLIAGEQD